MTEKVAIMRSGKFLADLIDMSKGTHASTGTTTKGVGDLKPLRGSQSLQLRDGRHRGPGQQARRPQYSDPWPSCCLEFYYFHVHRGLRNILTGTTLTENKVVGTEELTERTSADCVHGTRLEIDED